MSIPIVSIIIPTYNRTKYLALTLESISLQTCQDFEIIVIDDGSSDDEAKLLCKRYEKVKYIKISNSGGPAKPRNIGIQNSKGRYLAFVDDDDLWMPNKLEKQIEILDNNPDFGLVHSCCEVIDENGVSKDKIVGRPGTLGLKHGDVSLRMIGNWTVMMPTSFVRKEVVSKVGFFNEEIIPALEDVEYWSRCCFLTNFFFID
jgi:glycosyltransferase involved in cell wall biosynthesis